MSVTPQEKFELYLTTGIVSVPSLLGELFVIISYYKVAELQNFRMKLVLSMIYADLIGTLSCFLVYFVTSANSICIIDGFMKQFGYVSAVFWAAIMSFVSYKQASQPKIDLQHQFKMYVWLGVGIPLLLALM